MYSIYAIQCNKNGKVYIGGTRNLTQRVDTHFRELKANRKYATSEEGKEAYSDWQNDFNRYGESAFTAYLLEDGVPDSEWRARELEWISRYRATDRRFGYNVYGDQKTFNHVPIVAGEPKNLARAVLELEILLKLSKRFGCTVDDLLKDD